MDINLDMGNNTLSVIENLGVKIEQYGGNIYEMAMNQQKVFVAQWILELFVIIATLYGLSKVWKFIECKAKKDRDYNDELSVNAITFVIVSVFLFIYMIRFLFDTDRLIEWIFNPEYAATKELIVMAKTIMLRS